MESLRKLLWGNSTPKKLTWKEKYCNDIGYSRELNLVPFMDDEIVSIEIDSDKMFCDARNMFSPCVIAGEAALWTVTRRLGFDVTWQQPAANIFVFGAEDIEAKYRQISGLEGSVIFATEAGIRDLLLSFVFPISRVAYYGNEIWISFQCINALQTGIYTLPSYLFNYEDAASVKISPAEFSDEREKIISRVKVYAERGFRHTVTYKTK